MFKVLIQRVANQARAVVVALTLVALSLVGVSSAPGAAASAGSSQLADGETLQGGQGLLDDMGNYTLNMQGDGNLVEYFGSQVIWSSRTTGYPGARLTVQDDGNVVIYTAAQRAIWSTRTAGAGAGVRLVMQTDGNVVLYGAKGVVWDSGVPPAQSSPPPQNFAPSTLSAGQSVPGSSTMLAAPSGEFTLLFNGGVLEVDEHVFVADPNPQYREHEMSVWVPAVPAYTPGAGALKMQTDGNLVVYNGAGRAVWSTRTSGTGSGNHVALQNDGNLVVYNAAGRAVWASRSQRAMMVPGGVLKSGASLVSLDAFDHQTTTLTMQSDGNLVLSHAGKVQWNSRTFVAGSHLALQADGNLVVYAPNGSPRWSSHTNTAGPGVVFSVSDSAMTIGKGMSTIFWVTIHGILGK
ncbi:D-mannose binding lectin [Frankineae bacterium MT45]|nr:D-mannose binding lectin [Frankineae bacterium MT45]